MGLPNDREIWTWFDGKWQKGNVPILGSADHGTWLGTMVFDGARYFDGVAPDLDLHCARVNASTKAMGMNPAMETGKILELAQEGVKKFTTDIALYVRPMSWSVEGGNVTVDANPDSTTFALCIEAMPLPPETATSTLTTTRFTRPTMATAVTNAKAACLYPNNGRMLTEAKSKGFTNVISTDALGNVAETATSNIFMVKEGEYFTPIPNGTFLAGITRQRVIKLLRDAGETVHETVLSLDHFRDADEIFMTGNYSKVSAAVKFENRDYDYGPKAQLARRIYFDWAAGETTS